MKKRNKKESYNFINVIAVIACFGVVVVILTVLFASYIFDKSSEMPEDSSAEESGAVSEIDDSSSDTSGIISEPDISNDTSTQSQAEEPSTPDTDFTTVSVQRSAMYRGDLILVNNDSQYDFTQATPLDSLYEKRTKNYKLRDNTIKLSPTVVPSLNSMLDDLYAFTQTNALTIVDAFRTSEQQEAVFTAGKDTAVAGGSDYHTALTFGCIVYPSTEGSLTEGKFLWLSENCKYYGFIMRYPEGKTSITGYKANPACFRYVGEPHAYLIALNDYSLEEYLDFCKRFTFNNMYKVEYDGTTYGIYYCPAAESGNTDIKIPAGAKYTVSGDNSTGFIVTAELVSAS